MQEDSDTEQLPVDVHYQSEELQSGPFITPESGIPENFLHLFHSFGYESRRTANLQLLDERTLVFIAGNVLVLLDVSTKQQRYLHSRGGGGIGCIVVHPDKTHFAVAEKGTQPDILIYEYPSLQPRCVLRGGTERAYSCMDFNHDGSLLASVGNAPDFMLTIWNWRREEVKVRSKAVGREAYRVGFSSFNPDLLTSSGSGHINFWKVSSSFTGLKLQGNVGKFGLTTATDIKGFVELPDEKVVSGTDWGNLLLWDRSTILVEVGRTGGQNCHKGTVQPFALEDGQLFTIGSDGALRGWDFEGISAAADSDSDGGSSRLELEPLSEIVVGRNVCLSSIVRSSEHNSFVWFAQDSNGAIWKLDLSFTSKSPDSECLFSFHGGTIQGMDVSKNSDFMATISSDRSLRVFDFVNNQELITTSFSQSGTVLLFAPLSVSVSGCLLVIGFGDGVVRLMELCDKHSTTDAKLRLRQAMKPHVAAVTAVAYDRDGELFATGGADKTVFFFAVGEKYKPVGFVRVPGAVQALEWSPKSHPENRLLVLCQNGHVVEVHRPHPESHRVPKTFQLSGLPSRSFRFRSIKSQIKRDQEIARRQLLKEKKKSAEQSEDMKEEDEMLNEEEEDDEESPPIYIPDTPSPVCCGLYSQPGQFWLSMGGFDSGFLYHCKFSENQDEDPNQRQDEPFDFLPVENDDSIHAVTFSSDLQLLLCGMHSGSVRVYPLQPEQHGIASMQAYWSLSVHDNDHGRLRHVRFSHDDEFVLTAGDDGNIFSFSLLPPEELEKSLQRKRTRVPSPQQEEVGSKTMAQDIEDPAALSIELAEQKLQRDRVHQKDELRQQSQRKKLSEIQKKFNQVLKSNRSLSEHVRLKPEELQLDPHLREYQESFKAERLSDVRKELSWEQERRNIAFNKLQDWFGNSAEANVVTVVAIHSDHRVSTYWMPFFPKSLTLPGDVPPEDAEPTAEPAADGRSSAGGEVSDLSEVEEEEEDETQPVVSRPKMSLMARREARLRKAAERAWQAKAEIEQREKEWAQLYAEKPSENDEDPQVVQAIREAKENIRARTLEPGVTVPTTVKTMLHGKREELRALVENVCKRQTDMNGQITALRDSKVGLVSRLQAQARRLQELQQRLSADLRQPPPGLPSVLPEETPEKWLQSKLAALRRYQRDERCKALRKDGGEEACWDIGRLPNLLEQIKEEMQGQEEHEDEREKGEDSPRLTSPEAVGTGEEAEPSPLEEEQQREEEIRLLYEQDCLLNQMKSSVTEFDAAVVQLHRQKQRLDFQVKLADLCRCKLIEEIQLVEQFEGREGRLLEKLDKCVLEENRIRVSRSLKAYSQTNTV